VLVLDEPTNDLDIESLELLEQALLDFPGTLLLVSHDRAFVDNVVTQTLAPLGDGRWKEYVGGYSDWLAQRPDPARAPARDAREGSAKDVLSAAVDGGANGGAAAKGRRKLSYKEQKELDSLPGEIESLEAEQRALTARMSASDYGQAGAGQIAADGRRIAEIEEQLMQRLERWEALEAEAARLRS
jgi:ATP-binding cassette subfamily F protein uup